MPGIIWFSLIPAEKSLMMFRKNSASNTAIIWRISNEKGNIIILLLDMSRASSSKGRPASKPGFQTKFKQRGGTFSVLDNHSSHKTGRHRSRSLLFADSKRAPDESFYPTSVKLHGENFKHHHPSSCVCDDCLCGRHLCHLDVVKPDMTKTSTYQQDFFKKKPVQNKINISGDYDRLKGPNLSTSSVYLKDYPGQEGDEISRPVPEDLLKTGGPCPKLSSYSSGFPGYRGVNQYVKPTDQYIRGGFPLRSRSTYTSSFLGEPRKKDPNAKVPDNLKTGYNWLGSTTYGNNFLQPNPEDYAKKYKMPEKLDEKPDDKHQYGKKILIQKPLIEIASSHSLPQSALPKSNSKPLQRDFSPARRGSFHRTPISKPFPQNIMPSRPQSTVMCDYLSSFIIYQK